jgi:hypothetical protein
MIKGRTAIYGSCGIDDICSGTDRITQNNTNGRYIDRQLPLLKRVEPGSEALHGLIARWICTKFRKGTVPSISTIHGPLMKVLSATDICAEGNIPAHMFAAMLTAGESVKKGAD